MVQHSNKLHELRLKNNLSQSQLAQISGVNFRTLQDFDQGRKSLANAKGEMIYRLSVALGCSTDELLASEITIEKYDVSAHKVNQNFRLLSYAKNMNLDSPLKKRFSLAKLYFSHAKYDYNRIHVEDLYIEFCCFHLQQSLEFLIEGILIFNGLKCDNSHDIRTNLSVLRNANIHIPCETELNDKADIIYKWGIESVHSDSFTSEIRDIEEVMKYIKILLEYIEGISN